MFKDQITRYKVFNRKRKTDKKGEFLVQIEAYLNGNRCYFSTGIYLAPDHWNKKSQETKRYFSFFPNKASNLLRNLRKGNQAQP